VANKQLLKFSLVFIKSQFKYKLVERIKFTVAMQTTIHSNSYHRNNRVDDTREDTKRRSIATKYI